ncbi:hypothetical protein [Actinoplanes sp. N902-109]|uniref:hypothetical protein n=1 Tax=Actinoplanes sp. (strain N902-109) TaxID=649831 RepID=UPI00032964CB|nr:hypothetical protein [Actinoplanes sp. N902-109]AGL20456.1 hypothetical protein L083_6946 [Actinoplanes sp. N902-109]
MPTTDRTDATPIDVVGIGFPPVGMLPMPVWSTLVWLMSRGLTQPTTAEKARAVAVPPD